MGTKGTSRVEEGEDEVEPGKGASRPYSARKWEEVQMASQRPTQHVLGLECLVY